MRRLSTLAVVVLAAVAPAGCGRDKVDPSDLEFKAGPRLVPASYPEVGMRFRHPIGVGLVDKPAPGVFRGAAGEAFIAGFAYRRAEQIPRDSRELALARRRLIAATRKRGRDYKLTSARTLRVDGGRALELLGDQDLSNTRLRTRSLHVFKGRAEYVIELTAAPADFPYLDRAVYRPIRRTLRLTGKIRKRR